MGEQSIVPEVLLDKALEVGLSFSGSEFPISIFPVELRGIIAEVHECQGFPIDYIAAAMLVAIAVGIGNTHLAELKRGWQESALLYLALVGRPGTNKSHPLSFAMKPFLDFDYQENKHYERAYNEYDKLIRLSRKERAEAGYLEEASTEPIRRRFIVSDITPEGLSLIHAQNKRGLCLWTDELSAWFKNFNRYNSGSEEQFWLSVFSAKARLYVWQEEHAKLCDNESNEALVGAYCKLEVYTLRFCLIIQIARWACSEADKAEIDLVSVERAITLCEYFIYSAQQVYTEIAGVQLTRQQQQLLSELPTEFQTAEALTIAERLGMKERALKDFLSRNIGHLFAKEKHGVYRKLQA